MSTVGTSATWIGAQTGGTKGSFIQIGVYEQRYIPASNSKDPLPAVAYQATFTAFWSDTRHGFQPVYLGAVSPGDVVHARLRWLRGKWHMTLVDKRALLNAHVVTNQEAERPLHEAEWLQEDPVDLKSRRLFPYPRLSNFSVGNLQVNDVTPAVATLKSRRMPARAGVTLIPGSIHDDQFTIAAT